MVFFLVATLFKELTQLENQLMNATRKRSTRMLTSQVKKGIN